MNYVSIHQRFHIPIGRLQKISNIALRKSWMPGYFKCSKHKGCKIW